MSQEKSKGNSSNELGRPRGIQWGWIVAGLLALAISATLVLIQSEGTFEYYMTVSEYFDNQPKYRGSKVKLAGKVKVGSLVHEAGEYRFSVEDRGKELSVTFAGIVPDTFKEGVEVVVEGRGESGAQFKAYSLLAKCASKYEVDGLPPLEQMRSKSRN